MISKEKAEKPEEFHQMDLCFVFFYNTKRFLETGDDHYRLAGNGPVLVSKRDGYFHAYGSNRPVDVSIANFERRIAIIT